MLTELHLKNFKAWRDTGRIELKPLTVLFGSNSSGKSSLEQFFLMLKQTVESTDRKSVLFPGDEKSPVNLGSFRELLSGRDPRLALEFSFAWTLPEKLTVKDPLTGQSRSGKSLRFEAAIQEQNQRAALTRFAYRLGEPSSTPTLEVAIERRPDHAAEYDLKVQGLDAIRKQGRAWPLGSPNKFYGFPDEVVSYYQNAEFVQDLSYALEQLLRSMSYLGPWREQGKRLYAWTGAQPESVGIEGGQTIAAVLAAQGRKISYGLHQKGKDFSVVIAEQLQHLGLIHQFEVEAMAGSQGPYRVKVMTNRGGEFVDLPDVGFGVSQVLPVVVQCFYAPPGSIVLIEQPELHLHPSAQANLADVLIRALNARENGADRGLQLIVETHSEHFLNRLQRRIAERSADFSVNHMAAYFAHAEGMDSKLTQLEVDEDGNISNWPRDFFGDSMGDLLAMQRAIAERQVEAERGA